VEKRVPRWVWRGALGAIALALAAGLALVAALALGWNNPRPARPPDWEASGLPVDLNAASNETGVSLLGHPGGDFTLEVEAAPFSGPAFNGYGLVYRAQDPTHYYAFAVGSDGYYAVLRVAGDEETALVDWQQFPHVHRDRQANRLRVECAGRTCHFTINDEYATTVGDDTWLSGDVGLWVRGFADGNVVVRFLRAQVWE
jgi:hypothetical protein